MINLLENTFNLFYPKLCLTCEKTLNKGENILCISCRSDLPLTNFSGLKGNNIETSFYGRIPIEAATSLLFYRTTMM